MQPTLEQMVQMLPEAKGAVRIALPSSAPRFWAEYIVKKCYRQITNWRYLVEEISDALNHRTWPIDEVDSEDVNVFIKELTSHQDDAGRRDRERVLRTFLESVFSQAEARQ